MTSAHHPRRGRPTSAYRITAAIALSLLVAIVIAAVCFLSVTRQRAHLHDGTVWVTSAKERKAARFNVRIGQVDSTVSAVSTRFDVAQHDDSTLLFENGTLTVLRASTVRPHGRTDVSSDADVLLSGATMAVVDRTNGNVRIGSVSEPDTVSLSGQEPHMRLGDGGRAVISGDGMVYGYRPRDGMVLVSDDTGTVRRSGSLSGGQPLVIDDFTVIGDVPVASVGGTLYWPSGSADTGSSDRLILQSPDPEHVQSGWVAASDSGGLYTVKLGHGDVSPTALPTGGDGPATRPAAVDGCVYAAWSQAARNYRRLCHYGEPSADDEDFLTLQTVSRTSDLRFRVNHHMVLLNDAVRGTLWDPASGTQTIDVSWDAPSRGESEGSPDTQSAEPSRSREYAESCSGESETVRAVDDRIGARAGTSRTLDVLRNDEHTGCAVLRIDSFTAPDDTAASISSVHDGTYLRLDATDVDLQGQDRVSIRFSYTVDDGFGHTSRANVIVELVSMRVNRPPVHDGATAEHDVEQGGVIRMNALESFDDPDGDPLILLSAAVAGADGADEDLGSVSVRADGLVELSAGTAAEGRVCVETVIYDGTDTVEGRLYVSIHPAGALPAATIPALVTVVPGSPTDIEVTPYMRGFSRHEAKVASASSMDETASVTHDGERTITVLAHESGTHYVTYDVEQGSRQTQGLLRVEATGVDVSPEAPITADDVALLDADGTAVVEPLGNDRDPSGGVPGLAGLGTAPSGCEAAAVRTRVYLTCRVMPQAPVSLRYLAQNGNGDSSGTIVVYPAADSGDGVLSASDITLRVRTGGIVSENLLDHVTYTLGATVTPDHNLVYDESSFDGLIFVSGTTVRYQAGSDPGVFEARYTVHDDASNTASGTIRVHVHARQAESKSDPEPKPLHAQAFAGQTVRIDVPLNGIDEDGDDVMLLGLGSEHPRLGRIIAVGANHLEYEAYADSHGTDTFTYAVEDWSGRRVQADVNIAVVSAQRQTSIMARNDTVTLRPNTRASIQVTTNDLSTDGTSFALDDAVEGQRLFDVTADENTISFTTGDEAGTGYVIYTIVDGAGLSSSATLTVHVDPQAGIEPPTAYDYRVPPSDTVDRRSIDVDVSEWIGNPSGTPDELNVDVHVSARDSARRKAGTRSVIEIDLTDEARAVPYTVTNTTYGITSTAFLHVPAYGVFQPTLRPKAPELIVDSNQTLTIRVDEHVRVGAGKTARIVDGSVSATKARSADPDSDGQTLRFVPERDYSGPASVTFTVEDTGRSLVAENRRDKTARSSSIVNSAVLTLSITVTSSRSAPPVFSSPTLDVIAGEQAKTIDLTVLTLFPSGTDQASRSRCIYSSEPDSSGALNAVTTPAGLMNIAALRDAKPGTTAIAVTVSCGQHTIKGTATVRIASSSRPLAKIANHDIRLRAGSREVVDIVKDAYNPFPDTALSVVECRTDDAGIISVNWCKDDTGLSIAAASDAGAKTGVVHVSVQDATGDPERQVQARITVTVVDRPAAPLMLPIDDQPSNATVELSWVAGRSNGSPISEYLVEWEGGARSCQATTCRIDGLRNGQRYSFTVKARNEVGWSDRSAAVIGLPDAVPSQPADVTVEARYHGATVRWRMPSYDGSRPHRYTVMLSDSAGLYFNTQVVEDTQASFDIADDSITDGATFQAMVVAHNRAGTGPVGSSSGNARPWGDPATPTMTMRQERDSIAVAVTPGNQRNAGCARIELTGGITQTLPCDKPTGTFPIPGGEQHRDDGSATDDNDDAEHDSVHDGSTRENADDTGSEGNNERTAITVSATMHPSQPHARSVSVSGTITIERDADTGTGRTPQASDIDRRSEPTRMGTDAAAHRIRQEGATMKPIPTTGTGDDTIVSNPMSPVVLSMPDETRITDDLTRLSPTHAPPHPGTTASSGARSTGMARLPVDPCDATVHRTYEEPLQAVSAIPQLHATSRPMLAETTQAASQRSGLPGNGALRATPSQAEEEQDADIADMTSEDAALHLQQGFHALCNSIGMAIIGKTSTIRLCVTALLAEGHVLIEDDPGTGKTQLAQGIAKAIDVPCQRIQFTSDLMPSDVIGTVVFDRDRSSFGFRPGPVFAPIVLADEINRAPPKTQSALLEVMEEHHVTVDGTVYAVPQPFIVIATRNPGDQLGTYPLPDAQLDRFLIRTTIGHPGHEASMGIVRQADKRIRSSLVRPVMDGRRVLAMQRMAQAIHVADDVLDYTVRIVEHLRRSDMTARGPSIRGALALIRCARVWAAADGRPYVIPDDVKTLAPDVLSHRFQLRSDAVLDGHDARDAVALALNDVPVPHGER
ncbi:AAA family ATPase [Bifidobacterium sp. SO1]|uniref:AAA family ATPase n=1 Tax=Bifidobacterium sp. SO1 TaxID=2809029 RepID=UPI001BDC27BF|nr:AAA family ATPase [Bifidobacterium sp. SO1]MBT1161534.1 AAA family ATPase [Bifidobacterium sp. SO1]